MAYYYEDFTTFTGTSSGDITVTSGQIYINNVRDTLQRYLYKDYGVDAFTNDTEYYLNFNVVSDTNVNEPHTAIWAIANTTDTYLHLAYDQIMLVVINGLDEGTSTYKPILQLQYVLGGSLHYGQSTEDSLLNKGTNYYLTINRYGNNITCYIYSNSNRTTLIGTISMTCPTKSYRYIYSLQNGIVGNQDAFKTAYIRNLEYRNDPTITYHISGNTTEHARILVINESNWYLEKNYTVLGNGSYDIVVNDNNSKLIIGISDEGKVTGFGEVLPISQRLG